MKAVVMTGGRGTRLGRLTNDSVNKHRLPVYDRPMIEYVIDTIVRGGVTDIMVLLNWTHPELIMESLEDGSALGCTISYKYNRRAFEGPARHFNAVESWVGGEDVLLMLGDSFFMHPLDFRHKRAPHIWSMPLDGLDDPSKYGQILTEGDRVVCLVEKPTRVFSNTIQTGAWLFPPDVFELVRTLSKRDGELQFGDLSMEYVEQGRMTHTPLPPGSYIDLGTPEALLFANNWVARQPRGLRSAAE